MSISDANIKIWDINKLECIFNFEMIGDTFKNACFFPKTYSNIYIVIKDINIVIYNLIGEKINEIEFEDSLYYLEYLEDKRYFISGYGESLWTFYDTPDNYGGYFDKEYKSDGSDILFHSIIINFHGLFALSSNNMLLQWDFYTSHLIKTLFIGYNYYPKDFCQLNDKYIIIVFENKKYMKIININTLNSFTFKNISNNNINSLKDNYDSDIDNSNNDSNSLDNENSYDNFDKSMIDDYDDYMKFLQKIYNPKYGGFMIYKEKNILKIFKILNNSD